MNSRYYIIAFSNAHTAFQAQKLLRGQAAFATMPTLREISASCGISLRIEENTIQKAWDLLRSSPIDTRMYQVYNVTRTGGTYTIRPLFTDGK